MTSKNRHRLTLFLDPGLVKRAKAQAIEEGTSLTELVTKLLEDYLPKVVRVTIKKK